MPTLRDLKARRDQLRARVKKATQALRALAKLKIPSGAKGEKKRLRNRLVALRAKNRERVAKVKARIQRVRKRRAQTINTSPGDPHWGGSRAIGEQVVTRVAAKYGAWVSSRKRPSNHPLSISNPGSDHNEANALAYAWDIATTNGAPIAHDIARELGIKNFRTGTYDHYYVVRGGHTFRVQILWAVSGHFDHVHVGVRLVG